MPKGITHGTPPSGGVLCCIFPYRTITSLSTEDDGIIPHSLGTYKPQKAKRKKQRECDSGDGGKLPRSPFREAINFAYLANFA